MLEDKWNKMYADDEYVYGTEINAFIKNNEYRFNPPSKIACLAEGEGRNAVHLASLGHNVTAYDVSSTGLKKATHLASENNVKIETKQINLITEELPENVYDHAILVFGHVHKKHQATLINNLIRTVKKDGLIMFEVYSDSQINFDSGGPGKLDYLYNPQSVLNLIEPYECIHFYYGEAIRNEGLRHTGLGHVIQVIIKK